MLHNTVQGNWGLATDANNSGMTTGVFRDGYSADGSIFRGKSGKSYKRMLEQGPYVLKYAIRKGKKGHDVKIYINEKLIHNIKNYKNNRSHEKSFILCGCFLWFLLFYSKTHSLKNK